MSETNIAIQMTEAKKSLGCWENYPCINQNNIASCLQLEIWRDVNKPTLPILKIMLIMLLMMAKNVFLYHPIHSKKLSGIEEYHSRKIFI